MAAMELCSSLTSADKVQECTQAFVHRSVRNMVYHPDPFPACVFRGRFKKLQTCSCHVINM